MLLILKTAVSNSDKGRGKIHEVWEDSFDWKQCITEKFTWQKIDYMHGKPAKIPEGMSATQALKNQYFVTMYDKVRQQTTIKTNEFIKQHGYKPPYWQLVNLARNANEIK